MLASTAANKDVLAIVVTLAVFAVVIGIVTSIAIFENRRAQKRMRQRAEERERSRAELLRLIHEDMERSRRIAENVRRQVVDHPAVTLPVTNCERRERRRKFLPLEDVAHESR